MLSRNTLHNLAAEDIRNLAQDVAAEAEGLAFEAAQLEARARVRAFAEDRAARLRELPGIVESYLAIGLSMDVSMTNAAHTARTTATTVAAHWRHHVAQDKAQTKALRDARIIEWAARGMKNREIKKILDPPLSETMISRIIQKYLKAAHQKAAGPKPATPPD